MAILGVWISGKRRGAIGRGLWIAGVLPFAAMALLTFFSPSGALADTACDNQCQAIQAAVSKAVGQNPGAGTQVSALGWFDPSGQIEKIAVNWLPQAQIFAQNLYLTLFVIELFMVGLQAVLFRDNLGEFLAGITFKVFVTGFFIWLITDAPTIFTDIIGGFRQASQAIAGGAGAPLSTDTLKTLYSQEVGTVLLFVSSMIAALVAGSAAESLCPIGASGCAGAIAAFASPLAFACGALALLMFASLLVLSLTYVLITMETFIVMCGGVFFLGFAGTRFTMPFSQGYLRYAVNVGVKVFAFWLIVSVEGQLMPGILGGAGVVTGTTVAGGIVTAIAAKASNAILATDTQEAATTAAEKGPAAAAEGAAPLPGMALAAQDGAEAADRAPALAVGEAAGITTVAGGALPVAAAFTTAFLGVMFAAFMAMQVIVLNALASAVPSLASSLVSGASLLSAQDTLKGMAGAFGEAAVAVSLASTRMNGLISKIKDSPEKLLRTRGPGYDRAMGLDKKNGEGAQVMGVRNLTDNTNARPPVAPQTANASGQPPVAEVTSPMPSPGFSSLRPPGSVGGAPARDGGIPPIAGVQFQRSSGGSPRPSLAAGIVGSAPQADAGEAAGGATTTAGAEEKEEYGLSGYGQEGLRQLSYAKFGKMVNNEWQSISNLPKEHRNLIYNGKGGIDRRLLIQAIQREQRFDKEAKAKTSGYKGFIALEALNISTHSGKESGAPGFGDSGVKT